MTKRLLSLALIAVMMAMLFPAVNEAQAEWTMYVYTDNGGSLNVRSDPMTGDNVIGSLAYGEAVSVRMTLASGWTAITWSHAAGYVAYVQSRFLVDYRPAPKPTSKPAPKPTSTSKSTTDFDAMNAEFRAARQVSAYTVVARPSRASGWVNLRWAPSTNTEVIAKCYQGKELTVLAELKNWYQVEDPATGMIGFISSSYVTRR